MLEIQMSVNVKMVRGKWKRRRRPRERERERRGGLMAAEKATHYSDLLRPNFLACFCIMHRLQ
jgi:hypothetical protein